MLFVVSFLSVANIANCIGKEEAVSSQDNAGIIPDNSIISFSSEKIPHWKILWDEARESVRQKNFTLAISHYTSLLKDKPTFDDIRVEFVGVLMHLQRFEKAEEHLNVLLAHEGNNIDLLLLQADLSFNAGRYKQAVKKYSDLYKLQYLSIENTCKAQEGLALSFAAIGNTQDAFLLFDDLSKKYTNNVAYRIKAAGLALKNDNTSYSEKVVKEIPDGIQPSSDLLELYAELYEKKGAYDQAAYMWQELIANEKHHERANNALVFYYNQQNNAAMELRHLEWLAEKNNLTEASTIRLINLLLVSGSTDRSIELCDSSINIYEDKDTFLILRQKAITTLAQELIILVENEGSRLLWDDLVELTQYRIEIYLKIAELLRKQKKYYELADVLLLISAEVPDGDSVINELEYLLESQGRSEELSNLYSQRKNLLYINR